MAQDQMKGLTLIALIFLPFEGIYSTLYGKRPTDASKIVHPNLLHLKGVYSSQYGTRLENKVLMLKLISLIWADPLLH